MNIKIFSKEIEDGLGDSLKQNALAYCSIARPVVPSLSEQEKQQFLLKSSAKSNPDQIDLFYLDSVLVSVGWNANDDVFDKVFTFAARQTPVDKQFNFEHNEADIIGHITSSLVMGEDGKYISDNISLDELPSKYDIIVGSVLYKTWQDENLQKRMDNLIREIAEGKWFVSMECLFPDFDYAVITPSGDQKVIARNDKTSFLTKHLRVYGGEGVYQDHKIGRLLKNFVFSGKGLVANPANKRSLILNSSSFEGTYASTNFLTEKVMSFTQEQYDQLVADNKALVIELKSLRDESVKSVAKEAEDFKAKLAEAEKAAADLKEKVEGYKEVIKVKDEELVKANEKVVATEALLVEAKTELDKISAEKVKADRLSKLLKVVQADRANVLVDKFASVSDEMFAELINTFASNPNPTPKEVANATTLENVIVENKPALSVISSESAEVQKAAAGWMASLLRTTAKVKN